MDAEMDLLMQQLTPAAVVKVLANKFAQTDGLVQAMRLRYDAVAQSLKHTAMATKMLCDSADKHEAALESALARIEALEAELDALKRERK